MRTFLERLSAALIDVSRVRVEDCLWRSEIVEASQEVKGHLRLVSSIAARPGWK